MPSSEFSRLSAKGGYYSTLVEILESLLLGMHKAGDKFGHKLGKSLAQVWNLSTLSTEQAINVFGSVVLYQFQSTDTAQKILSFTRPKILLFNQLLANLYSLSTSPITNTKLIKKELYS